MINGPTGPPERERRGERSARGGGARCLPCRANIPSKPASQPCCTGPSSIAFAPGQHHGRPGVPTVLGNSWSYNTFFVFFSVVFIPSPAVSTCSWELKISQLCLTVQISNNKKAELSQHFFFNAGTVVRGGRKHLLINNQEAGLSQHLFCSAAKIRRETSTVKKLNCLKHFLQRRYCKEKRKLRIFVKKLNCLNTLSLPPIR